MAAQIDATMVLSPGEGTSTEVKARAWVFEPIGDRQLTLRIAETALVIQGPAADVLALVDRVRDALVAEVGRVWPVESAHAAVGA